MSQARVSAAEVEGIIADLIDSYRQHGGINHLEGPNLPSKQIMHELTNSLEGLLFRVLANTPRSIGATSSIGWATRPSAPWIA